MRRNRQPGRIPGLLCAAILLLSCLFSLSPALSEAGSEALTVGVPTDRCPVFYTDAETGGIIGIGADLIRIAAEKAGYNVTLKSIGNQTLPDALDSGEYDLVLPFGSAIPSASGKASVVSDNLIRTPFTLVTRKDVIVPPLNSLRVGMLRSLGGAAETVRQLYPGMTITLYETMGDCVKALRGDEVDALLHNSYVWSYVLQKPSYHDLAVQPTAMFSMDFRAGTPDTPEGREIIQRLNGGIAAVPETQQQAVVLDYTSRRLYRYDLADYIDEYALVLLLIICLIVAVFMIVVERQRALRLEQEEKLRRLIDQDPLTGTLSMSGFRKRVEELLRAHPDIPYVLTYANIRNFKYVNDSLGMEAGNELLRFWAEKTQENLGDDEAVSRIGADHFAVLSCADGEEKLVWHEEHVLNPTRHYFIDRGKENRIQICGGLYVLTPEDYRQVDVDHMLDYARVAEKKVRETHSEGYAFYNPEQWEKGRQIAEVINYLPAAIRDGDLHVWYQPQVDGKTGEIIGAEALCRWDHEKLGWLYPSSFVDTLEQSGMIYDLDRFVWDRVCRDLRRWNEQGHRRSVSVNVSRCDFQEGRDIPGCFRDLIREYGLSADQLRIEITETAFADNPIDLIGATEKLREFGFAVEMDDFGSGHSSLHMLKEVPVDRIKLDLHFLTESGDLEKGRTIITHIIRMVHDLGMEMITEGVETEEQARFLLSKGCAEMQGYWFHKPMPVEDFEKLTEGA